MPTADQYALAAVLAQAERVVALATTLNGLSTAPLRYEASILDRLLQDFEKAREVKSS